jgi:hypothetical protein
MSRVIREHVKADIMKYVFHWTGSTRGGTDIATYTNVGVVNHYTFHGLRLQNGHEYYATVKGI